MGKTAFLFPGQGAQALGMGAEVAAKVPAARSLFDRASALLGYDLLAACVEGPLERLNSTAVSQPALFVAGLAAVEQLRQEKPDAVAAASVAAGLSLGEYTALVFADAMSFDDALAVVKVRGESMQAAADATPSAMTSVLGLDVAAVEGLCQEAKVETGSFVRLSNYLCPGNLVVSGETPAIDVIERLAPEKGAMKTIRLAVAGAFHTPLMKPADDRLAAALAGVTIRAPRIPVISNVDALPHSDPSEIRDILVRQVLEPVRWEDSMRYLLDNGFDVFYELGPGRVLAGLMKRIHRRAEVINVTV